jgi:hypothetical protein
LLAVVGLFGLVTQGQATPAAPQGLALAAPAITMVRDYCGKGFHRENKQRDKWGAWRGKCVQNKPKKTAPPAAGAPGGAPPPASNPG